MDPKENRITLGQFSALTIDGQNQNLSTYQGKVVLIVNVASRCGYTRQYSGLQKLWDQYKDHGLVILGFPCNQFGGQEPGSEAEIRDFCFREFHVDFPLFSKVKVNGGNSHELFKWLRAELPGPQGVERIKWNFTKFLLDRHGLPVKRYSSQTRPEELETDLRALL